MGEQSLAPMPSRLIRTSIFGKAGTGNTFDVRRIFMSVCGVAFIILAVGPPRRPHLISTVGWNLNWCPDNFIISPKDSQCTLSTWLDRSRKTRWSTRVATECARVCGAFQPFHFWRALHRSGKYHTRSQRSDLVRWTMTQCLSNATHNLQNLMPRVILSGTLESELFCCLCCSASRVTSIEFHRKYNSKV